MAGSVLFPEHLAAQEVQPPADSLAQAPAPTVRFETTQGTWMNVDVSPDGRRIVFDLLGDLYIVPITGGTATRLTSGPAFDTEPVFSPDGQRIAFVSDRSGSDNLWLMEVDGRYPRAFTHETMTAVRAPEWIASDDFVLAALKTDGYWLYRPDGSGAALGTLLPARAHVGEGTAGWSRDGRFLYSAAWDGVRRIDVVRGFSEIVTERRPAGFRFTVSPDGRWLAFGSQRDNQTGLRLLNLVTREQRWLIYPLPDRDNSMLMGATSPVLPRLAFTPDSRAIILATGGTLQRLDLRTGRLRAIRFRATVEQELAPRAASKQHLESSPQPVHGVRDAHRDRSGRRAVFTALGRIWIQDGRGPTRPLIKDPPTTPPMLEREPALSPDGQSVAYVTWHDVEGGHLWRVSVTGGPPQRLTERPGVYRHPVWSPDGTRLAVAREEEMRGGRHGTRIAAEAYVLPATGGPLRRVAASWADAVPAFSPDGETVIVRARQSGATPGGIAAPTLLAIALDTEVVDTLAVLPASAEQVVLAPDGRSVAYTVGQSVYTASIQPLTGLPPGPVTVAAEGGLWPAKLVAKDGGRDLRWEADSRMLTWVRHGALVRLDLASGVASAPASAEMMPLMVPALHPESTGSVALDGATVITMRGDEVIPDATVLVTGGYIAAVGPRNSVTLPAGVHHVDVRGKTIIPGLIDLRGAVPLARDLLEGTNLPLAAKLAVGVTTVRARPAGEEAPAAGLEAAARYAERLATGAMVGARFLASGAVTAANAGDLTSLDAARALVREQQALGGVALVQTVPLTRRQRQWLATAARDAALPLIGEPGELRLALTMAADGYHTIQGTIPNAQLYDDVRRFLAAARTIYVPTLLAATGGRRGAERTIGTAAEYFLETTNVREDPVLRRFGLDSLGTTAWRLPEDYHFLAVGRQTARLAAQGVPVAVGTAGKQPGVGVHWEMWALELSGFSAHEALRAATVSAAQALGLDSELGTIEVGKVADLVVLDGDPLRDLRQSRATCYVMKRGELFDAATLAMRWPRTTLPLPLRDTRYDPPPIVPQAVTRTTDRAPEPL